MTNKKRLNIVLDIGKTNVKLVFFDSKSNKPAKTYITKQVSKKKHSVDTLDANYIYQWSLKILEEQSKKASLEKFVCTTHGCSLSLIDEENQELLASTDYEFNFSKYEKKFQKIAPNFEECNTPLLENGLSLGQQLFYLNYTNPKLINKTSKILFYPQYMTWKFTNKFTSEISYIGCHSHLWNFGKNKYSSLITKLKIKDKLPPINKAWDIIGEKKIGSSNLKIMNGIHDSNASYLYFRNSNIRNFTLVSTGTWYIIFNQESSIKNLNPNYDMLANMDVFGKPISSIRFMGGREYDFLTSQLGVSSKTKIDKQFSVNDYFIYPSYASGGPFKNKNLQLKKYLKLKKEQRHYLVSLYIAFVLNFCLDKIKSQNMIILDGPIGKNQTIMKILATLRHKQKILKNKNEIGTSFGATNLFNIHKKNKLNTLVVLPLKDISIIDSYNLWLSNIYKKKLIKGD